MQYRFEDLVDMPGFQQVMQSWYSVAGVATALLDAERHCLCAVGWQELCTRFHHLPPQAEGRCFYSDDYLFAHLCEGQYVAHRCANGLLNCAMPVMVKGEHVATLLMGQFLHAPLDEVFLRQQAQELGVDADAYQAALQQVPIIAEERLLVVMTAQVRLAQMLATLGWEHHQLLGTSATFNADLIRAQQHIALMLHTAQTASSALEPDQVLERVADALVAAVDVPYCGIYLLDAERGVLVPHVVRGPLSATSLANLRKQHLDPATNSLVGETLERQSPAVWYDAASDSQIGQELVQSWNVKSVLAVPIRVSAKVLGLAMLSTSSASRHFTADEIELVWGIANSVALAVDNARLYAETRQRLAESQGLQRVAAALLRKVSPEEVLEIVCAEAQQLTGAAGSAVLLVEDATWLRVTYNSGTEPAFFDRIPIAGSLAGITVRQNEPFLTNIPAGESYEYLRGKRPTAFLSVPLHANGDVIGVLEVVDKPGGFVKDDIRIVSLFANQAAINIEHARLNQQAGQLAVLEERQRLARELHDSVVQSLYSMALYADAAALALAAGKRDVTVSHLQELRDTARNAMHDMRLLIFELHPPALEEEGLVTALRLRLSAVEARAGVQAELEVADERRLPIEIEQELYRIAQEALNNIMKHAQAQHVMVRLEFTAGDVCLQVRDDGAGFDPSCVQTTGGLGLHSFEARAAKIGGSVVVDSHPGQGTTVTVHVAVKDEVTE
ncbi:MAG: PocR ligand-binding domain-containing protein [Anaerolineae bacterium]|nr:PocR ligand-binding domain-containing protein [Anaerolineae bacterium]